MVDIFTIVFAFAFACPNFGSCRTAASVTAMESVSFLRANKVWVNEMAVLMTRLREASERFIRKSLDAPCHSRHRQLQRKAIAGFQTHRKEV